MDVTFQGCSSYLFAIWSKGDSQQLMPVLQHFEAACRRSRASISARHTSTRYKFSSRVLDRTFTIENIPSAEVVVPGHRS